MFTQQLTTHAANLAADAMLASLGGTMLRIYDGEQPKDADDLITDQVLLVECAFGFVAFAPAEGGVAAAYQIQPGAAINSGKARWFRTDAFDGSVGPWRDGKKQSANLELTEVHIAAGRMVEITNLVYQQKR